jgi:copper resistance protein B
MRKNIPSCSTRPLRVALISAAAVTAALAGPVRAQTASISMAMVVAPPPATRPAGPQPGASPHDMANMPGMAAPPPAPQPDTSGKPGRDRASPARGAAASDAMAPMRGGRAPASARDPYAYSGGYQGSAMPNAETADRLPLNALFIDQLEGVWSDRGSGAAWDVQAWSGGPFNRAWLRSEGDVRKSRLVDASVEALWFRSFHPFWGTQLGVRQDVGEGPNRTWAALGVQGATPYWYGMEATAYLGEGGRTAARLKASSDLRITQRLVLRPEVEANLYGRSDQARGLGSGLATFQTELRLRYEFRREFAPYLGIVWNRGFGQTQKLRRAATGENDDLQFVVGLKLWR